MRCDARRLARRTRPTGAGAGLAGRRRRPASEPCFQARDFLRIHLREAEALSAEILEGRSDQVQLPVVDDEEAANSPSQASFGVQYGGGDIKYTDVNGDGVITEADRVPIGMPTSPEIIYGFGASFGWKGIDFSVFFQGLANESFWIDATASYTSSKVGTAPFVHNTQLLKAYADSHWTQRHACLLPQEPARSFSS